MILTWLAATGFRNLSGVAEFTAGLNILHGANAQGKTSWLEAISLLALTRSFRTTAPREAIEYGAKEALLRGAVCRGTLVKELQLLL
ncbi:MAG: AAA family ATPase, partial [Acidobacteriota bacterium]